MAALMIATILMPLAIVKIMAMIIAHSSHNDRVNVI